MARRGYDFEDRPGRSLLKAGFIGIVVVGCLSVAGGAVFGALGLLSQPARVLQRTFDADSMIANFEWFRQQHADILAMEPKLANATAALTSFEQSAGPRSGWALSDRQQWDQLNRIVLGLRNQRVTMVAAYNARASQTNRSIFINPPVVGGPVLPTHID